jgi:hypothetical protein
MTIQFSRITDAPAAYVGFVINIGPRERNGIFWNDCLCACCRSFEWAKSFKDAATNGLQPAAFIGLTRQRIIETLAASNRAVPWVDVDLPRIKPEFTGTSQSGLCWRSSL